MIEYHSIYTLQTPMFEGTDNCSNDPINADWEPLHEGEN